MNTRIIKEMINHAAKYTLLKVTDGTKEFYITGIKKIGGSRYPDVIFKRLLADDYVIDESPKWIDIKDDNTIILEYPNDQKLTITPLKEKEEVNCPELPNEIHLETLMNTAYIDKSNITTTADSVYMPLDPQIICAIPAMKITKIKLLMYRHLDGAQAKYQLSRVPAFTVKFTPDGYKIYGHLHNIKENKPLNKIELFDSEDCLSQDDEFKPFVKFANTYIK